MLFAFWYRSKQMSKPIPMDPQAREVIAHEMQGAIFNSHDTPGFRVRACIDGPG
jgi:hypothetical protein